MQQKKGLLNTFLLLGYYFFCQKMWQKPSMTCAEFIQERSTLAV